jgi:hypothetical protein
MEFVHHNSVCEQFWLRLSNEFPSFRFVVHDDAESRLLAQGNTIPAGWSGLD